MLTSNTINVGLSKTKVCQDRLFTGNAGRSMRRYHSGISLVFSALA